MEQPWGDKVGVKPGDEVRLTGSMWVDRLCRVREAHVDAVTRRVWIVAVLDNGMAVVTSDDGFEVVA